MNTEHKIKDIADKMKDKTAKIEKKATKAVGKAKAKIQKQVKKIWFQSNDFKVKWKIPSIKGWDISGVFNLTCILTFNLRKLLKQKW